MPQDEILLFGLFTLFVLAMLALDLGVFHRKAHTVSVKEGTVWSVIWISLALLFNLGLYFWVKENSGSAEAARIGLEFFTAYVIEKALSVDNIFVFIMIFAYFGVPSENQHKVLFWGIIGALIFRAIFIFAGVAMINRFEWVLYVFGAILIVSGWKMMMQKETEVHPEKNIFIRLAKKFYKVDQNGGFAKFFSNVNGVRHITPLFLVLITIESTDIVFAVDSIPAVFAITRDPFIVYSSNVFAILGLRALYFVLAGAMTSFYYLKYGLSAVLIFVGIKMVIADLYHVPIGLSLSVIGLILFLSIGASLLRNRRRTQEKI